MKASDIIAALDLAPHPEGGHFAETFRDAPGPDGRSRATAIYFLLSEGECSHWHGVDATEIWLWHAGAPLKLEIAAPGQAKTAIELGPDLAAGQRPQVVVPSRAWQSATSQGAWTLVSCVVAPGFEFAGFELAAPDFEPS